MIQGMLYIISAPSGAGKSSLVQALLQTNFFHKIQVSISHTTRLPRLGEVRNKHYFFINQSEFQEMVNRGAFLEYAKIFGNYYGTLRENVEQALQKNIDIILDIDWQGAKQIREKIPNTRSIFILPPSKDELYRRLQNRGKDNEEIIKKRIAQSVIEMSHYNEYDYLIVNDHFNNALNELKIAIIAERLRISYQKQRYNDLIMNLLLE